MPIETMPFGTAEYLGNPEAQAVSLRCALNPERHLRLLSYQNPNKAQIAALLAS